MVGIGCISYTKKTTTTTGTTIGTTYNNNNNKKEIVPMTGIEFLVRLIDYSAEVTIRQRFENKEADPIEATYELILDRGATVTGFRATVGSNEVVTAQVREKEAARDAYEDGIASGRSAFLLEDAASDDKPDVFRVCVGNLAPKKSAVVALTYVVSADVSPDDGAVEFRLPSAQGRQDTVIGERSVMDDDVTYDAMSDVADGVHLRADIVMGSAIRGITSPTHPLDFELTDAPGTARVSLREGSSLLGAEEFVLRVKQTSPNQPCARVAKEEEGGGKPGEAAAVMACFCPDLEHNEAVAASIDDGEYLQEIVFVLDRSGSMSGGKMKRAKETLQLFLRSLDEGTLFNIVSFGSTFSKLFTDGSRPLNDETLGIATAEVAAMEADLGGTDILAPLRSVFQEEKKKKNGVVRQLFVLTDGQVDNPNACIACVRREASTTRVFTFGIGRDTSAYLVRGLSRAGAGACEILEDSTELRKKVMRQVTRALRPALTDVKVEWKGFAGTVRSAPRSLPPLFSGSRLVVYALVDVGCGGGNDGNGNDDDDDACGCGGDGEVVLTGKLGGKKFEAHLPVDFEKCRCNGADDDDDNNNNIGRQIKQMAAKMLINDYEESASANTNANANAKEALDLSLKYGVLCKQTAFVAVSRTANGDAPAEGSMVERSVKIEKYKDEHFIQFGGFENRLCYGGGYGAHLL